MHADAIRRKNRFFFLPFFHLNEWMSGLEKKTVFSSFYSNVNSGRRFCDEDNFSSFFRRRCSEDVIVGGFPSIRKSSLSFKNLSWVQSGWSRQTHLLLSFACWVLLDEKLGRWNDVDEMKKRQTSFVEAKLNFRFIPLSDLTSRTNNNRRRRYNTFLMW